MYKIRKFVECRPFQWAILVVILFNSILFGLETSREMMQSHGAVLLRLDQICLWIFVAELGLKISAYGLGFPRDPWNVFDFLIVAVSFAPDMGMFSSVRLFCILIMRWTIWPA